MSVLQIEMPTTDERAHADGRGAVVAPPAEAGVAHGAGVA